MTIEYSDDEIPNFEQYNDQEKIEVLLERNKELQEALRKQIEFKTAKELPKEIWLHAVNAPFLFASLAKCIQHANKTMRLTDAEQEQRKIFLNFTEEGQVLGARLEE